MNGEELAERVAEVVMEWVKEPALGIAPRSRCWTSSEKGFMEIMETILDYRPDENPEQHERADELEARQADNAVYQKGFDDGKEAELVDCPNCNGEGTCQTLPITRPGFREGCWVCNGTGLVTEAVAEREAGE